MKISLNWLLEWVNPKLSSTKLATLFTMAGLEVESIQPVAKPFSDVYIGKVLSVEKHPEADRLKLCIVDIGSKGKLHIVCGAQNVRTNMHVPVAIVGAILPHDLKITQSTIRGKESQGMLCSAKELGLTEESDGLFELPDDAPLGENVWNYLKLNDEILEVSITPNRGDCLSTKGLAIELAALTQKTVTPISFPPPLIASSQKLSVKNLVPADCPQYAGRVICNIRNDIPAPIYIKERLRRSGIRSISMVVDVMNYVMLELGQPMHAFDLTKIKDHIEIRKARKNETLLLLDGNTAELAPDTMIIADSEKPLAIAGVMGGFDSGVNLLTKNVFLESALFQSQLIAKSVRQYALNSESSYRFERGVDPALQIQALERATDLLLNLVGGEAGPITVVNDPNYIPSSKSIFLELNKVEKILGVKIPEVEIESILQRLGFVINKKELTPAHKSMQWEVIVPARRFDINIQADLFEEIARIYGYEKIPQNISKAKLQIVSNKEECVELSRIRHALQDLGYQEIITYSFIDQHLQKLFDPETSPKMLLNPISSDMECMRTTLWPGLVNTLIYNLNRQQQRARFFETGLRYRIINGKLHQESVLSGLLNGFRYPLQWAEKQAQVDFYDVKGDIENLLKFTFDTSQFHFKASSHPALHPGQTASIYRGDQYIGVMGALHPTITAQLKIDNPVFVYELLIGSLLDACIPKAKELSKFPEIRRDIAILIDQSVPYQEIKDTIVNVAGDLLKEVTIFDIYQGKNIPDNKKSIAIALMLQHISRTLVDTEIVNVMDKVIVALKIKFTAELRG